MRMGDPQGFLDGCHRVQPGFFRVREILPAGDVADRRAADFIKLGCGVLAVAAHGDDDGNAAVSLALLIAGIGVLI